MSVAGQQNMYQCPPCAAHKRHLPVRQQSWETRLSAAFPWSLMFSRCSCCDFKMALLSSSTAYGDESEVCWVLYYLLFLPAEMNSWYCGLKRKTHRQCVCCSVWHIGLAKQTEEVKVRYWECANPGSNFDKFAAFLKCWMDSSCK